MFPSIQRNNGHVEMFRCVIVSEKFRILCPHRYTKNESVKDLHFGKKRKTKYFLIKIFCVDKR